ncbi:zinc ribbon domain-containing protein [Deinococcus sp. QL22]|uniref:double zinc ribbon domain-containing protein n=1 Tax=Deinococcus sp. QL22 TaxID=2939437 RepID=UPI002017BCA3|nr:hypothetical protein [Deinococcus sp. QL22]UQN08693.1 hypothetical protein M1R55_21470 [Deinococcus sp. QL22]
MNHDLNWKGGQNTGAADRREQDFRPLTYRLCPRCLRAVPGHSPEHYCVNDGTKLLSACPVCQAAILSPYALFCAGCGHPFSAAP